MDAINEIDDAATNRAMKIFTILSATEDGFFNMNYLSDASCKLIPNVLSLAQQFDTCIPTLFDSYMEQTGTYHHNYWDLDEDDDIALTSMFELLRGWAVPSLWA